MCRINNTKRLLDKMNAVWNFIRIDCDMIYRWKRADSRTLESSTYLIWVYICWQTIWKSWGDRLVLLDVKLKPPKNWKKSDYFWACTGTLYQFLWIKHLKYRIEKRIKQYPSLKTLPYIMFMRIILFLHNPWI